jgi:hypothetical protein
MTTEICLVVEDAAEVVAIRKNLVLAREVGAARVHEIDARQAVLCGDFLRAKVLLHREREIRSALHRGVVRDHDALAPMDAPDAGDDAGRRHLIVIQAVRRERRQFEKRRVGIEHKRDALPGQQLATGGVPFARGGVPAEPCLCKLRAQIVDHRAHRSRVFAVLLGLGLQPGLEQAHHQPPVSSQRSS